MYACQYLGEEVCAPVLSLLTLAMTASRRELTPGGLTFRKFLNP